MVKHMERVKIRKRIVAWIMTFVMVLTTMNMPAFTLGVKATEVGEETTGDSESTGTKTTEGETTEDDASQEEQQYTVTLDAGEEGVVNPASVTVTYGETYGELPTPTRNGYTFAGWYTEKSDGTKVESKTPVEKTEDHTLYAHWTAESYTVTLDAGEEGVVNPASVTVTYGETYGELPTPTRDGYTFAGWYTEKSDGTKVESKTPVEKTEDHTLYAHWTAESYTVTLDAGEEGVVNPASVTVTYGETYGELPTPTRDGYTFAGWYTEKSDGTKVESKTPVETAKDHTLYAHWTRNEFTIELVGNNDFTYTGEKIEPSVKVTDSEGTVLKEGTDYTISYSPDNINAGQVSVTVTGIGNYKEFSATIEFKIKKALREAVSIACANTVYGKPLDPQVTSTIAENANTKVTWYYKSQDGDKYEELKNLNLSAGTYSIYAEVGATQNYEARESEKFAVTVAKAVPQYTTPNVSAFCGDKLSEVTLEKVQNGHFEWVDSSIVVKEGTNTASVKFIPKDTKNYEVSDIKISFNAVHDFQNGTHLIHELAVDATEKKEGHREYYKCETCNKYFNTLYVEEDYSCFIKPYVVDEITVTLGSNVKYNKLVLNGQEAVASKTLLKASTYKKYLTFDEKTGTIKTKKYYKKKLKNPTITITDKAGETHKVKVKVVIAKPTKKQVDITRTKRTVAGITGYVYTIKYDVKDAKKINITVDSGSFSKSDRKKVNALLKKRVTKSKGETYLRIKESEMKKSKITFNVVVDYGNGNKSQTYSVTPK